MILTLLYIVHHTPVLQRKVRRWRRGKREKEKRLMTEVRMVPLLYRYPIH